MTTPSEALAALRAPDQRHQGRAHTPEVGEVTADRLAAVEAHAVSVRAWNPGLIPGLLQTTRYAAAAIVTTAPALPTDEVQRRAHQRAARVDAFMTRWQHTGRHALFVVPEQTIRQPLTHRHAHRAQVRQLLNLGGLPNIEVRVMPTATPSPGRLGQCTLYALEPETPVEHGPRLAYTETPLGGWYSLRPADVALLRSAFDTMASLALSPDDTRSLLTEELAA